MYSVHALGPREEAPKRKHPDELRNLIRFAVARFRIRFDSIPRLLWHKYVNETPFIVS